MSAFALRLAVLPSVLLLLFVVRRNKNSRDPMSLLVWLAVLGAVSTIPAVVVELVGGVLLYYMGLESGTAVYEAGQLLLYSGDDRGTGQIPWNVNTYMEK